MERDLYERFRDHPIREIMSRAAAGDHVYDDEIADLQLPKKVEKALRQAFDRVDEGGPTLGPNSPDALAAQLIEALPEHHETRQQTEERRAAAGDAEAQANIAARDQYWEDLADKIRSGPKSVINR